MSQEFFAPHKFRAELLRVFDLEPTKTTTATTEMRITSVGYARSIPRLAYGCYPRFLLALIETQLNRLDESRSGRPRASESKSTISQSQRN
jgi:hypothetical protein